MVPDFVKIKLAAGPTFILDVQKIIGCASRRVIGLAGLRVGCKRLHGSHLHVVDGSCAVGWTEGGIDGRLHPRRHTSH